MLKTGDRVLAEWDEWWYPGTVCGTVASQWDIQFDDGDRATVPAAQAIPLVVNEGMRVEGRWQGQMGYYQGLITSKCGHAIHIRYDDGDEEWTSVSMIRVHPKHLPRPWLLS